MALGFRYTGVSIAVGLMSAAGFALGWWQEGAVRPGSPAGGGPEAWALPKSAAEDFARDVKILTARKLFGAAAGQTPGVISVLPSAAPAPVAAPPPRWRIGGVVTSPDIQYVVLLMQQAGEPAGHLEIRRPGEKLPDGSTVRSVDPGAVTVDHDGKLVTIKMFAPN